MKFHTSVLFIQKIVDVSGLSKKSQEQTGKSKL